MNATRKTNMLLMMVGLLLCSHLTAGTVINYTTVSGNALSFTESCHNNFKATFSSNTYANGEGAIELNDGVSVLSGEAFFSLTDLATVTLPEGITEIGPDAFNKCTALTSVTLPSTLETISQNAFIGCESLTAITIPAAVTSIGFAALADCSSLASINVTSGNTAYSSVGGVLFNNDGTTLVAYPAGKGTSYTLPSTVTTIGPAAFYMGYADGGAIGAAYPSKLTELTVNSQTPPTCDVTTSFSGTASKCVLKVPFAYVQAYKTTAPWSTFKEVTNTEGYVDDITLSETELTIAVGQSATLTATVNTTYAADKTFTWSSSDPSVASVDANGVVTGHTLGTATITATANDAGHYSVSAQVDVLAIIRYTTLSGNALQFLDTCHKSFLATCVASHTYANGVGTIILKNDCTALPEKAFFWLTDLATVTIPEGITRIGQEAFSKCVALTSVTLPSTLETIEANAFLVCERLASITIPAAVTSIGAAALADCTSLTSISVASDNTAYSSADGVLFSKDGTTLVAYPAGKGPAYTLPSTVTAIGSKAFYISYADGGDIGVSYPSKLTQLTVNSTTPPACDNTSFSGTASACVLKVPFAGLQAYKTTASWSSFTEIKNTENYVDDITLNVTTPTVVVGETITLTATVNTADAPDQAYTWSSSDASVATVNASGVVTGVAAGTATITATAHDAGQYSVSAQVIVRANATSESFEVDGIHYAVIAEANHTVEVTCGSLPVNSYSGTVTIPETIEYDDATWTVIAVGEDAFKNSEELKNVILPSTIIMIGEAAFEGCDNLVAIVLQSDTPPVTYNSFASNTAACIFYVLENSITSYMSDPNWNIAVEALALVEPSVRYPDQTFSSSTKSITISAKKQQVFGFDYDVYYKSSYSYSFYVKVNSTTICTYKNTTLPGASCYIFPSDGQYTVSWNNSASMIIGTLTNLILSTPHNSLVYDLNNDETGLIVRFASGGNTFVVPSMVLYGTTVMPVVEMRQQLFGDNKDITALSFPSLQIVNEKDFSGCTSLTEVNLPNVEVINASAFYNCTSLTEVNFPSVAAIGASAFYNCTSLTEVNFPSVEVVNNYAFSGCTNLKEVVFGEDVQQIGTGVFNNCNFLEKITIASPIPPTINSASDIPYNLPIFIPSNAISAYLEDELWNQHQSQFIIIGAKTEYDVEVTANDNLSSLHLYIGESNLLNVVSLKVSGTINSYDIMLLNNKMLNLQYLDLSEATIVANSYVYYPGFCSHDNTLERHAIPTQIKTFELPQSLTAIGDYCFADGPYLDGETIKIPSSVTQIGNYAFQNSQSAALTFQTGSQLLTLGQHAFDGCNKWTDIRIPSSVTTIGEGALSNCYALQSVTLPYVGSSATATTPSKSTLFNWIFQGGTIVPTPSPSLPPVCSRMNSDYSGYISDKYSKTTSEVVYLPYVLETIYIEGGHVLSGAFSLRSESVIPNIKNIYFGDGVTMDDATGVCNGLKNLQYVTLPSGMNSVPAYAFQSCNLQSIEIPNSVTGISVGTFKDCKQLKQVSFSLPSSLTAMGAAFEGCSSLESITIPDNVTMLSGTFASCTKLSVVHLNDKLETLSAFSNCKSLSSISLPEGIKTLGGFSGCTALSNISIPASVTTLYNGAFQNCTALATAILPTNSQIATIPNYAFSGCSSLERMDLPVSITQIGDYAFQSCTSMTEVKIPSSINSIGKYAFNGCSALNDVYTYTIEPQKIDQNTFSTYTTATLHMPAVSYYSYYYDTQWSQFLRLVNFDEPYSYVYIANDFDIYTETAGTIDGNPLMNIDAGGGVTVLQNGMQSLGDVHIRFDGTKSASLIGGDNNLTAANIYLDITVKADTWHFFCFPFDIDLTKVQKEGSYIFRRYDGGVRAANGTGGWQDIVGTTVLHAGLGYIFRTNTAGTLSLPVAAPDLRAADVNTALAEHAADNTANKNWNFIGNPYLSYYDLNDLAYDAPIIVWNGTAYAAFRPGDDEYVLQPFQPFFIQRPANVTVAGFEKDARTTYLRSQDGASSANRRRARAGRMNPDRKLINLTLTDGTNTDRTRVVFNEKQSLAYEMECDAAKFISSENVPQLYTIDSDDNRCAINERPEHDGVVRLGIIIPAAGDYTFSTTRMDVDASIEDTETGTVWDLTKGDYTFTADKGTYDGRFLLTLNGTTGIRPTETASEEGVTYDASGRRVEKFEKGIHIANGKKMLVK